jgi:membrane protein implicated in regulation of membrane protease activity
METIFLACFAFGALFTLVSVVLGFAGHGAAHLGHGSPHVELGHGHGNLGHAHADLGHGQADLGHGHADLGHGQADLHGHADLGHGHGLGAQPVHASAQHVESGHPATPLLNASSVVGSLTWFGAAGYLLTALGDLALPAVLLGALAAGAVGWYLVARFLGLVLAGEREMDPAEYRLEGTVGQVTVSIPAGGTGEVVFSKSGARRSEAARALGAEPIARGAEVVITHYADGFATVQPWGEFLAARDRSVAASNGEAS